MLNVPPLPMEEKQTLEEGQKHGKKKYFRDRCQCIQLSSEGFSVKELSRIYKTRTRTIYTWIHNYAEQGFLGLKIQPGRGIKAILVDLAEEQIAIIKHEISQNPQSLREVAHVLSEKFGFTITKAMLKKYLKKTKVFLASVA